MSFEYVRKAYGVPAKRGGKVRFFFAGKWNTGTIKSATHMLRIAPDEYPRNRLIFHPDDVEYVKE
jgi:hypothetical protein